MSLADWNRPVVCLPSKPGLGKFASRLAIFLVLVCLVGADSTLLGQATNQTATNQTASDDEATNNTETNNTGTWKVGLGRRTITPRQPMWMSGYGHRDRVSEGTLTDLWAKVLILESPEGTRAILVTLDLVGIDSVQANWIREVVGKVVHTSPENVVINCSHTHTGPVVGLNLEPLHYRQVGPEQQSSIDHYLGWLLSQTATAASVAFESRFDATLAWGNGNCQVAVNRRNNPEGEVPRLRTAGKLQGPFDHDVPTLVIRDGEEKVRGILFGYACHATVLSFYQWSGDYPGFAQLALEDRFPDAQAMFWAGCGADQNPLPRRSVELAEHYGQRLAASVESVVRTQELTPIKPTLSVADETIEIPLVDLPSREELEATLSSKDRFQKARAQVLLEHWDSEGELIQSYDYPVTTWELGDQIQWVFLGGEVVVDFALRIKEAQRKKATWVAGYSQDVMAYIPSRRVLREGGYEGVGAMVYYGLPGRWDESVEERIVDEVERQLTTHND